MNSAQKSVSSIYTLHDDDDDKTGKEQPRLIHQLDDIELTFFH